MKLETAGEADDLIKKIQIRVKRNKKDFLLKTVKMLNFPIIISPLAAILLTTSIKISVHGGF